MASGDAYPAREQRHHTDIHGGLMFFFVDDPNPRNRFSFDDGINEDIDRNKPWLVIGKEYVEKMSGGWWRYLVLGSGPNGEPVITWHEGSFRWIRRVADPAFLERKVRPSSAHA